VTGVPSIFSHFVTNLPAFHEVLVFLCVKSMHVPYVSPDERYLVGRIGPKEYRMYRCIARYGYKDVQKDDDNFENLLVMNMAKFIMMEAEDASSSATYDIANEGRMAVITTDDSGTPLAMRDFDGLTDSMTMRSSKSENLRSLQSSYEQESISIIRRRRVRFELPEDDDMGQQVKDELMSLMEAKHAGEARVSSRSLL
jgi:KUP system potassium uptake protein